MIITKSEPFTLEETEKLQEAHGDYIKAVIDLKKKICSAGARVHRESYDILLQEGSVHENVWGGGIIKSTKGTTFHSMINIRPAEGNESNQIESPDTRKKFEDLIQYFFNEIL